MVEAGLESARRSAAATADLLQLLETRGIDGRGIELSARRCQPAAVAKGLAVVQGDADTDPRQLTPDDAFDYVILSQDPAGDAATARGAGEFAADRAGAPSCRSRISGSGRCVCNCWSGGHMPAHPKTCRRHGTTRRTSIFLHHQGFRAALRRDQRQKWSAAVALDLYGRPVPLNLPWWGPGTCFGRARACSC